MTDPKRLTMNDPVSKETLLEFAQLQEARLQLADRFLQLEQDKIQLLASAKKVDDQQRRLFEAVLVERGYPPLTRVTIDARTGHLEILGGTKGAVEAAPVETPSEG